MAIDKKTIAATMLVYGIARGAVDEIKPTADEAVAATTDTTVFNEALKAIHNKGLEVSNGK